ncbi:hypothetical protein TRFO_40048 [Tritrichomonas foetus]|uniref:Raptor N-terminal CASPase-like domain-containing protein n=1 Tax=Tritrichomonas foetus TaxID=1144522 RepID=A0A1J4J4R5_9EUKA|nr:hypothetical protein TRFO_40048 [Tritrichomonas foetus]|eukprot:OHS93689.1 hypothetical protein TRFO_40048 [Tritrichomonas foetus]
MQLFSYIILNKYHRKSLKREMNNHLPNVNTYNFVEVDDGFGSPDDSESYQYYDDAVWQKPQLDENIPDLTPMFELLSLSKNPPQVTNMPNISISESEYQLCQFSYSNPANFLQGPEPIECVVINVAHLEQFPKAASPYSATLPCIFSWFDAHTAFSSEYPTIIQSYFKTAYNSLKTQLRFFFSIAPSQDRLNNLKSIRKEVLTGRVMFHYIGYGFPDIDKKNIWCSDRRSRDFTPFKLETLFESLRPPTLYLFDCNNAAAAIIEFKATAEKLKSTQYQSTTANPINSFNYMSNNMNNNMNNGMNNNMSMSVNIMDSNYNNFNVNWDDWLCIGATGIDEELPDDHRLPRDFLTSTILTPIKMAVICHILQYYRLNLVNPSFPLDPPCEHLWNDKKQESARLSIALAAITDGIASDTLPKELYLKIFCGDRETSVLFRHFLLAQYLLRPYRIHPCSYPEIPDLSIHPMWRQWPNILDTAICAVSIPRPVISIDIFARATASFDVLIHHDQFSLIKPYHLTLLYHSLLSEEVHSNTNSNGNCNTNPNTNSMSTMNINQNFSSNDQALMLLAEYAMNPQSDPKMLVATTIFPLLFIKLLSKEEKSPVFYPLCCLILALLYHKPEFSYDIPKDVGKSTNFPLIVFNRDLPEQTRIAVAAIVATLVVSHETFQQICTSIHYLERVRIELSGCQPTIAVWLMLTVRRAFYLYSPDPASFIDNGLHIQATICAKSDAPEERAAAISMLTCFMRPFECKSNIQLMLMAISSVFNDASYIVRFHFVLLLKKFLMSYDNFSGISKTVYNLNDTSYKTLYQSIFGEHNANSDFKNNCDYDSFSQIDDLMHEDGISDKAYAIALSLLYILASDPHPSVKNLSRTVIQFLSKQKAAFEIPIDEFGSQQSFQNSSSRDYDQQIVSYGDDEFEAEHLSFASLDQNDSLHHIMLRSFVVKNQSTNKSPKIGEFPNDGYRIKLSNDPILFVDFDSKSGTIAAATRNTVYFVDSKQQIFNYNIDHSHISDIKLINNSNTEVTRCPYILFSTTDGSVHEWRPPQIFLQNSFRADLRIEKTGKLFLSVGGSPQNTKNSKNNDTQQINNSDNNIHSKSNQNDHSDIALVVTNNGNISQWSISKLRMTNIEISTKIKPYSIDIENSSKIILTDGNKIMEIDRNSKKTMEFILNKGSPIQNIFKRNGNIYSVLQNGAVFQNQNEHWIEILPKTANKIICSSMSNKMIALCFENKSPSLFDFKGNLLKEFDSISFGVSCSLHKNESWFAAGDFDGNLFLCHY